MFNWLKNLKSQMSNDDVTVSKQSTIPKQPIKRSNPHRILICDDAAFMRMMLKNILTQDGYEVVAEAQDGLEAIERYSEFKPDLVFMDITMPKMDGIDATRKIKEMDSRANIVVCSAMGQQEWVMEAIRSGAKNFIVKPFTKEAILKAVVEIFEPRRIATPPVEAEQSQTPTAREERVQNQTVSAKQPTQPQNKRTQTTSNTSSVQKRPNLTASNTPSIQANNKQLDKTGRITTYQQYMDALKQYYIENEGKVFDVSLIVSFIIKYGLDMRYDIEIYEVFADLITIELNYTHKLPCSQDIEYLLRSFKEYDGVTIKYNGVPYEILLKEIRLGNIDIPSIAPPVKPQNKQTQTTINTSPVQTQSQTVRTTPLKQAQNKQSVNSAKSKIEYPNLADIKGKVLEAVWLQGTDDNGFFDYFADVAKKILPSWGRNIVPQNDRQKSIVVRDNECWVCQYFFNQYDISPDGIVEYNLHMDSKGQISVVWDDTIPDTDIYRTGTAALWTVLGDFISLPISDVQKRNIKTLIKTLSQGVFVYEEQYHDIRSYSLGRSATIEEIAMLLSLKDVWAKIEPVRK